MAASGAVAVEITATALLNSSPPSSPPVLGTKLPLTFFDLTAVHSYFKLVIAFPAPTPPDDLLRSSFSAALAHFPVFAGRLANDDAGRQCVALNDAGARLVEARTPVPLSDVTGYNTDVAVLVPAFDAGAVEELLLLQLTRFTCGGLAVGLAASHRVVDAHSVDLFLAAWADICRGRDIVPSPSACLIKRAEFIAPRDPLQVQFAHAGTDVVVHRPDRRLLVRPQHAVVNVAVVFSREFIAELRSSVPGATRFQCLFAHLWKKITVARDVDDGETSGALIAVNCRKRMPVPAEFFGNMLLNAQAKAPAGDLKRGTLAAAAGAVHEAVARIDGSYIRSYIDFGKETEGKEDGGVLYPNTLRFGLPGNPDVAVSSWLGFGMTELDLGAGGGTPAAMRLPMKLMDGLIILCPSCAATAPGGVVAHVGLRSDAAHEFSKICYQA